MSMMDPLDAIMKNLRRRGAVEPGDATARQARMGVTRAGLGVAPGTQPGRLSARRPPQEQMGQEMQGMPGQEMGQATDMTTPQQEMTPIIIDQLNETILSIKVELQRESDSGRRRYLEQSNEKLRQQILELGGDPIWADESIEEGLQKLQGHGYVGMDRLDQVIARTTPSASYDPMVAPEGGGEVIPGAVLGAGDTQMAPTATQPTTAPQPTGTAQPTGMPAPGTPEYIAMFGQGAPDYSDPTQAQAGTANDARLASDPAFRQSEINRTRSVITNRKAMGLDTSAQEAYLQKLLGMGTDDLTAALQATGAEKAAETTASVRTAVGDFPTPPTRDSQYGAAMDAFRAAGLDPSMLPTLEEYMELRGLEVAAAAADQRWVIQRELDRFEENFPNEFSRATKQITDAAAKMSGERQEEFAARGLFYTSIMANSLGSIDRKTLELIGEIARDAANRVADLHSEMMRVNQWEILQSEIARRQARLEWTDQRMQMTQIMAEIQYRDDMYNLELYRTEVDTYFRQYDTQLIEEQRDYDRLVQQAGWGALAQLASGPLVSQHLTSMGMTPEQVQNMDPMQGAALIANILDSYAPMWKWSQEHELNKSIANINADLTRAKIALIGTEKSLLEAKKAQDSALQELVTRYVKGQATNSEISRLERLGVLSIELGQDPVNDAMALMNLFAVSETFLTTPGAMETETGKIIAASLANAVADLEQKYPDLANMLSPTARQDTKSLAQLIAEGKDYSGVLGSVRRIWDRHTEKVYSYFVDREGLTTEQQYQLIQLLRSIYPDIPSKYTEGATFDPLKLLRGVTP